MFQHVYSSGDSVFTALKGKLIVSCQASHGEPLDHLDSLTRMAASVLRGGAGGLRAEGVERVLAFRALTDLPILGIVKTYDANGDVYITPDFESARSLSAAKAETPFGRAVARVDRSNPYPVVAASLRGYSDP